MIENNLSLILVGLCLFISGYCTAMARMRKFQKNFDYVAYLAVKGLILSQKLLNRVRWPGPDRS